MEASAFAAFEARGALQPFKYTLRPLAPELVLIDITHCGVCHSDLHAINNDWMTSKYPLVPGHEIIGVVRQIGDKVQNVKVGDRVGVGPLSDSCGKCEECRTGREQLCPKPVSVYNSVDKEGHKTYGGFSNMVIVNAKFAFKIPERLSSEVAAPLLCAGITVFSPLWRWARGAKAVGIIGIGGLGHLGIQFSKALGCKTVALSSSPNKEAEAKALGADAFVVTRERKNMLPFRRSLDFILCCVTEPIPYDHYLSLLKSDGVFCLVGMAGPQVNINLAQLVMKRISVCGSPIGSREDVERMLLLAAEKQIVAKTELYPMSQVNDALKRVETNAVRYRCVLKANL